MTKTKITVKKHSAKPSLQSPSFSIKYSGADQLTLSKNILSALRGQSETIMLLQSSAAHKTVKDSEEHFANLIALAKEHGIEYRYTKQHESASTGFSKLFTFNQTHSNHELSLLITNSLWHSDCIDKFRALIPARFFFLKSGLDSHKVFEEMQNMMDAEKLAATTLVVFDWLEMGQMGISTEGYSYSELNSLLNSLGKESF